MAFPNLISRLVAGLNRPKLRSAKHVDRQLIRQTFVLVKPAVDGAASTTTAYTAAYQIRMPRAGKVLGAYVQPAATLTADASHNATIKVVTGDGAAGAEVIAASAITSVAGTGNWAAGDTVPLTLSGTAANTRFIAGAVLSFSIAKTGNGVAVPVSVISVDIEWEGVDEYLVSV